MALLPLLTPRTLAPLLLAVGLLAVGPLAGQTGDELHPEVSSPLIVDTIPLLEEPQPELGEVPQVTPGGAFVRSMALPGWGHAATGAHFRGAFYVSAQSGAVWMLSKSLAAHREARRFRSQELRAVRESLQASGISDPDSLRVLANGDPRVEEWDELIESRSNQVEDWVAASLFILLLQATDAFVAAHLMDHPEPLTMTVAPHPTGGWDVGVRWPTSRLPHPWR